MTNYQITNIWLDSIDPTSTGWLVRYDFRVALKMPFGDGWLGCTDRGGGGVAQAYYQECPVAPLSDFPPAGDLCSASLEAGSGKDVNNACPPLDPRMQEAKACLDTKIHHALGSNADTVPGATIRTQVYQEHLAEIYRKWKRLQKLTPEEEVACATVKSRVDAEKQRHGIAYEPASYSPSDSHVNGLAVDMAESTIYAMASTMAPMDGAGGMSLTDYLRNPVGTTQGCKLCWGGTFQKFDPVHIQYCP
jgi:hypothetical protein